MSYLKEKYGKQNHTQIHHLLVEEELELVFVLEVLFAAT
jgi:hypothetical protein